MRGGPNTRKLALALVVVAILTQACGDASGGNPSTPITRQSAAGFLITGDVEAYAWECSGGDSSATYETEQKYSPDILVKLNDKTSPETVIRVTLQRKNKSVPETITGTAFGVRFGKDDISNLEVWAEDASGVQTPLYLACDLEPVARKPIPSIALPSYTPAPVATTWYPKGFYPWSGDPSLAWRYVPVKKLNCSYSFGYCFGVYVVSRDGCFSSLYAELSIFDKSGVQIDYANDLMSSVAPYQKVQLMFDTFNERAHTGRLTQLDCY
jgi:hypothetical protein